MKPHKPAARLNPPAELSEWTTGTPQHGSPAEHVPTPGKAGFVYGDR